MKPLRDISVGWRVGVDIGGTFTDVVVINSDGEPYQTTKFLTDYADLAGGVVSAIAEAIAMLPRNAEITEVIHGTTLVANTLIQRRGACTGLITTSGFRDILEIGREARYDLYDLDLELPDPLVPRRLRLEVAERISSRGEVLHPIELADVRDQTQALIDQGAEAVAIAFLHSYRYPQHERAAADFIRAEFPALVVSASHEVLPIMGEFARVSATVANAYVLPIVDGYLNKLEDAIARLPGEPSLLLVTSTGVVVPSRAMRNVPLRLLESGPAGGILAGVGASVEAGVKNSVAFDMGGTTAKAGYIVDERPRIARHFEVARVRRFRRGSGLPIHLECIQLIETGAGGGSIAWKDDLGLLRVGPGSAGSTPGPACYGLGGTQPTVTDADLILGYLGGDEFVRGSLQLDLDRAREALASLCDELGLPSVEETARAVRSVVDEQMAAAALRHGLEQGLDPAAFTLVATGGAGPLHAFSVAEILGIQTILVPAGAGVASAHGFLRAPFGYSEAKSAPCPLPDLDWEEAREILEELQAKAKEATQGRGREVAIEADLRYRGQGGEGSVVTIPVPLEVVSEGDNRAIAEAVEAEYRRRYHRVPEGVDPEIVTWRVRLTDPPPTIRPLRPESGSYKATRMVFFESSGTYIETPVVGYEAANGEGPLIVTDVGSTLVVPPGARIRRLDDSLLRINLKG